MPNSKLPRLRQLGLLLASLVLVGDCVPLGWWALRLLLWIRDMQVNLSRDPLFAAFQTIGMVCLGLIALVLLGGAAAAAGSAIAVSSAQKRGVVVGLAASLIVVALSAYLIYVGVPDDPRPWHACLGANSLTGAYLSFYLWRQLREEKPA